MGVSVNEFETECDMLEVRLFKGGSDVGTLTF